MKKILSILTGVISLFLIASCGAKGGDTPFFEMRGIVLCWDDIDNPEVIDWLKLMKDNGLNTISVCGKDYRSPEYAEFKQKCIDAGLDFEYEEHAMSYLMPRELFDTHPEYFRMDENGVRQRTGNGCPSNEEGLKVIMDNVAEFVEVHKPTNHKYYTWLYDGGDICHCEKCQGLTASDQGLIFENHIIKALREIDPEAQLAHLAYDNTTAAPTKVKPEEGIFLEWAPFYRRWDKPLSDRDAIRDGQKWSHGDYLKMLEDNLKVFPAETAQVLEYWLDVSLVSGWKKPQKQLTWYNDVYLDDLKTYASYGIRNITAYGIYIDDYYVETFKDISFIEDYGKGMLNFKPEEKEEPFFDMRGIVLAWEDLENPEVIDWLKLMKDNGLNTISVFGRDYRSPEYMELKQKCIDEGFDFEYEEHAMSYLMPRELFETHPEYFRMDKDGVRQQTGNGCPSNEEGLKVMMSNVKAFVETHKPTNHKYYTWLYDGGDICHCEKCKGYNAADQGLIFENHIIKALREIDPEAQLAHLAYEATTPAPTVIKPEEGIFLEWAPFYRRWDMPLSDRNAKREGMEWSHGDYLDMLEDNLKVFPAETAQVLEYWLDVSQRSGWQKPQKQLVWYNDVYLDDLRTYAGYGIRNITCYGAWIDANYVNMYHDYSFIEDYGQGMLNFKK